MNIPLQTQSFELKQALTGGSEQVTRGVLLAQQPNKRFATVEALGALTVFRASDAAGSITGSGKPISVFESGAILVYLAEKTRALLPSDLRDRKTVLEWVFWQVGGLGPMAGQNHHFVPYAPEKIPYAIERYVEETNRLYGVLDRRLAGREFISGDTCTIADIAAYPWIVPWKRQQQDLDSFPNLRRWFNAVRERPATQRAYARGEPYANRPTVTERGKKILFGQTAQVIQPSLKEDDIEAQRKSRNHYRRGRWTGEARGAGLGISRAQGRCRCRPVRIARTTAQPGARRADTALACRRFSRDRRQSAYTS